jgi:hypothetical protein
MSEQQKQTKGKFRYYGRVDIPAMIEPVAELREQIITVNKKYPESMAWPDIQENHFIDALQRHLNSIMLEGLGSIDNETGLPHLYAIGFNYMVLSMKMKGRG